MGGWLILTSFGVFLSQQIAKDFLFFSFFFFCCCFFPFSDWFFVIELLIQVYRLKYFLPIYPPLSTSFIISLSYYPPLSSSLSLLLSTSFIISLSYYYFFDAALLVCVCYNSYFVLLGQICFSHFFSPFSQTNYYSRQEISTNLPVKIVM